MPTRKTPNLTPTGKRRHRIDLYRIIGQGIERRDFKTSEWWNVRPNREQLLGTLKARFEKNMNRHKDLNWSNVQARLETNAEKLWSLNEIERTGGEPDAELRCHCKNPVKNDP